MVYSNYLSQKEIEKFQKLKKRICENTEEKEIENLKLKFHETNLLLSELKSKRQILDEQIENLERKQRNRQIRYKQLTQK